VSGGTLRIFLIDDQTLVRQGLKALLERNSGHTVSGEAKSVSQANEALQETSMDVVLLDVDRANGLIQSAVGSLKELRPRIPVVVVSRACDPVTVRESLAAGADGFLPKSAESAELIRALDSIEKGGCFIHNDVLGFVVSEFRSHRKPTPDRTLTSRERTLIKLLSEGYNNKDMARELFVSVSTVKNHLRGLFRKFEVADRTKLVVEAINRGVLGRNRSNGTPFKAHTGNQTSS
jgi:DNA-binding NarL/FixJ family response regulator